MNFLRNNTEGQVQSEIEALQNRIKVIEAKVGQVAEEHPEQIEELLSKRSAELKATIEKLQVEIAKRKQTEEALQENKVWLLEAQRVGNMGFIDWNLETKEMYWSEQVYHFFGIDPQKERSSFELIIELIHPDDLELVQKSLEMATTGVKKFDMDHRFLRRDGKMLWVHTQAELIIDRDGIEHLFGTVVHITERKRAEKTMIETNARLKAIIESPKKIIIFSLDKEYRYTAFNQKHKEEIKEAYGVFIHLGVNFLEVIDKPEVQRTAKKNCDRVLGGESFTEIQELSDLGISYEYNWNPIYEGNKNIIGIACFIQEICGPAEQKSGNHLNFQ